MFWKRRDKLSAISLGGAEGYVGHNCWYISSENHAVVVDCGIKPQRPDFNWDPPPRLGILDEVRRNTVGIITHAHLDHIGAVAELIKRDIPVYLSQESRPFLARYSDTLKIPEGAEIYTFNSRQIMRNGDLEISFIPVQHSIPGTHAVLVRSGKKSVLHLGDFKLNGMWETREERLKIFREIKNRIGTINCLILDILNVEMEGFTPPEQLVLDSIERIVKEARGRVIITFFSSNLRRMEGILGIARSQRKRVAVFGRGMSDSYLQLTGRLPSKNESKYGKIILVSGSQGEEDSGLVKMAQGEHKFISLFPRDTVVNSARCIPDNEEVVRETLEKLHEHGVTTYLHQGETKKLNLSFKPNEMFLHVSGHEQRGGLQEVEEIFKPELIVPFHAPEDRYKIFQDLVGGNKTRRLQTGETLEI